MPPLPDPRRLLAKLTADVRAFEAEAERTKAALAAASAEVEGAHLTVRMLGAHLTGIEFGDSALTLSPSQLSEEVRRAVAAGSMRANRASADAVRRATGDEKIARGIEEALPDDGADRYGEPTPPPSAGADEQNAAHLRPMTPEEQAALLSEVMADDIDDLDDPDDDVPEDLAELARQLDYTPSTIAPEDQQAAFEQQVDRIKANASRLPALMTSVEGHADSEAVEVTVNAAGALLSTRFHAGFARGGAEQLAEQLMTTYEAARTDAGRRLSAALATEGFSTPDRTLRDLGL